MSIRIAIFASGNGTNAEQIINYFNSSELIKVNLILSNNPDAFVLQRAIIHNIPSFIFNRKELNETDKVINKLIEYNIDFLVLAGFMIRVPDNILNIFKNKIINIHPALLPKFGGKGMYGDHVHKAVIDAKENESGITIHYVNELYDEGQIIFQTKCQVSPDDTPNTLAAKIHHLEHKHYPKIIEKTVKEIFKF